MPDPSRLAEIAARVVSEGGPLDGLYDCACMLNVGRGGAPKLPAVAIATWKVLARAGHARSAYNLGVAYEDAIGVERDAPRAAKLYAVAAAAGELRAANNLALMLMEGRGVPQDDSRAAALLIPAAAQGMPEARDNLAALYLEGRGMPRDEGRAYNLWVSNSLDSNPMALTALNGTVKLSILGWVVRPPEHDHAALLQLLATANPVPAD